MDSRIETTHKTVNVYGKKFYVEVHRGAFWHGKFRPDYIWVHVYPVVTARLTETIRRTIDKGKKRGYGMPGVVTDLFLAALKYDSFYGGCPKCGGVRGELPLRVQIQFRKAIDIDNKAELEVYACIFLGWNEHPGLIRRRSQVFCAIHGATRGIGGD